MPSFGSDTGNVLYLIVCAAPPAYRATEIAKLAADAGWDVCVVVTPSALNGSMSTIWLRPPATPSEALSADQTNPSFNLSATLYSSRQPRSTPSTNGPPALINDTVALGLLNEALGRQIPTVVCPWVNDALRAHPTYHANTVTLQDAGVRFAFTDQASPETFARVAVQTTQSVRTNRTPT